MPNVKEIVIIKYNINSFQNKLINLKILTSFCKKTLNLLTSNFREKSAFLLNYFCRSLRICVKRSKLFATDNWRHLQKSWFAAQTPPGGARNNLPPLQTHTWGIKFKLISCELVRLCSSIRWRSGYFLKHLVG